MGARAQFRTENDLPNPQARHKTLAFIGHDDATRVTPIVKGHAVDQAGQDFGRRVCPEGLHHHFRMTVELGTRHRFERPSMPGRVG